MKKQITSIITNLILFLTGIIIIALPDLMKYINKSKLFFDFITFLRDYPKFKYVVGIVFTLVGLIGMIFVIISANIEKKVYIIQKGLKEDFGNIDLNFNQNAFFNLNKVVYTNICSTKTMNKTLLNVEKKNIYNFYAINADKKEIAFVSVSVFPFIVYAGYCIGEAGKKVIYYHYDRNQKKVKKIPYGKINTNQLSLDEEIIKSKIRTICISVSYEVDKKIVKEQFNDSSIYFYKASSVGTESIKNRKDIEKIAQQIRDFISESTEKTNLLLSCPAELCLAIGQKLKSPGLPTIDVYNYNAKKSLKWNWSITLDDQF